MKKFIKYIDHFKSWGLIGFLVLASACDDSFLDEEPQNFLSPDNAFETVEGFEAAIYDLHRRCRGLRTSELIQEGLEEDKAITTMYASGTDLAWFVVPTQNFFTDYSRINSTNAFVRNYWRLLYRIVSNANTIITRVQDAPFGEADKLSIEARGRFFRAFAYRYLVYLWGDVPLVQEEIRGTKFDFTRTPVAEILAFMRDDLTFASEYLVQENPGDGRLSKAAADHVLAETLISLGDYPAAIEAASRVINDGQYALMQARFGNHTNLDGDVFWDLFRLDNQNRSSGNTESIWVWQLDFETPGGSPNHRFTRAWSPRFERLQDSEGTQAVIPVDTMGRGVGFVKPTRYLDSLIWLSNFDNDIRNSEFNMQRTFINNNPASAEFGQAIVPRQSDLDRNHYVYVKKAASPEGYPQGYDRNGRMYTDIYAIRLAETYLLRAEAHIRNGDATSAAADINVVRSRARAGAVAPGEVDIDYLLDERARELVAEEPRRLTLTRMNKLVERVRQHNPISAPSIQPFHNLFPIPQEDIDANLESDLGQNEGYE